MVGLRWLPSIKKYSMMILPKHQFQPRLLTTIDGASINIMPVPLRRDDPSTPWCYAASLSPFIPLDDDKNDDSTTFTSSTLPLGTNFLATQVWPSSRIASTIIERYMDKSWSVCELGCGPGLPSLTAAKNGAREVIATDVDELALEMVHAAAIEQGFLPNNTYEVGIDYNVEEIQQQFVTRRFDLTSQNEQLPNADLYILSDVFESSAVAEGAAWHIKTILSENRQNIIRKTNDGKRVWVFAQSDRSQRDSFLASMREWFDENCDGEGRILDWTMNHNPDPDEQLWLFDLDETMVEYN